MATYTIAPKADGSGFDITVIGSDGVRHKILRFATRDDAKANSRNPLNWSSILSSLIVDAD
jgi:hypothetical protein